jgi:transcriptional regulator with XRE-family HTH domain
LNKVRQARRIAGLSIEEAAQMLNIPAGYLSQIENGHRHISPSRAVDIAALYNLRIEDIFLPSRYAIREAENLSLLRKA